jgi:hypothetical protein
MHKKKSQTSANSVRRHSALSTQRSVLSPRSPLSALRSDVSSQHPAISNQKSRTSSQNSTLGVQRSGVGGPYLPLRTQHPALSLTIADITLSVHSTDPSLKLQLQGATKNFCTQGGNPDITIEIGWDDLSGIETGDRKIFDSGSTWRLYETNGNYKFYFYSESMGPVPYKTAEVQKNFSRARVFIHNPYFDPSQPIYPLEYPLDELLFVHFLSQGRGVEVHACGVSDSQGKGYLFLGQSGAGKSTMAGLWKDQPGITILSDDRIVLRKVEGGFWMYGTPWHGEGRFFSASRARLSRIYFLEKRKKNEAIPYRAAEAIGRLTACSFLPFHNREPLDFTLAFFEEMVNTVPAGELRFVPDKNVVELIERAGAKLP